MSNIKKELTDFIEWAAEAKGVLPKDKHWLTQRLLPEMNKWKIPNDANGRKQVAHFLDLIRQALPLSLPKILEAAEKEKSLRTSPSSRR